jgi:hypothetical protein
MDLFLIDAIGPFFRGIEGRRINWSKVPFHTLELAGEERERRFARIREDLAAFAERVSAEGFNAVSLDDVAHLAHHPLYENEARASIAALRTEFRGLFALLRDRGLAIYVTMDVLSYTPALRAEIGGSQRRARRFLREILDGFLADFPEVSGVILRIGECDGKDVRGLFKSELLLRRAGHLNELLHTLLPMFERRERRGSRHRHRASA